MRIAIGQLTTGPDPDKNLRLVEEWTRRAADAGARVVVFPEASMACFGTPLAPLAQPLDGPWADGVREIARATGTVVVAGMFTPADEGRVANTLLATGPRVEESYDKIHLYDAFGFRESETVAPGSRPAVIDVDGVRLGLATCYDVRFPELFRAHADAGAVATLLAASWGPAPASSTSGSCWCGPARWTPPSGSPPSARPIPAPLRAPRRPASGTAWWSAPTGPYGPRSAPIRSCW